MEHKTLDQVLFDGRRKSGLSLRKAVAKLRVPAFYLKRLEYGYYHIGKNCSGAP